MRRSLLVAALLCAWRAPAESGLPADGETLRYSVNWPSGLPLGEGEFRAVKLHPPDAAGPRWHFTMTLEAGLPSFEISDHYRSVASPELCSLEFEKHFRHGKRKADERTIFDGERGTATRQTLGGGGKSEFPVPGCPRDGLAFLYFLRRELSRGRLPGPQTVFFGAPYQIRLDYGGRQMVRIQEQQWPADRLIASVTGKASQVTFELFFSTDHARTPLLVRVPFALGTFTMELVREP
ncbi:MAG: DUF3108 domain-containing protein [Bryobacterales bacterium]|nr:DUF3108 domain-containing protein [Bryobacteraceae bacterium]MDW8355357.1 DUF3108 domain-containing protein [Bryobacterales bacterium]